jgi:hypothetical protein
MKNINKVPIQIYLEPEQEKIIGHLSKTSGKSKASIIRSCISQFIAAIPAENDPALNIMNLGASGKKDIAQRHDEFLNSYQK